MSADAKVWYDGLGYNWSGIHDGDCPDPDGHKIVPLSQLLVDIENCMGCRDLRWEIRIYPNGQAGLIGYTW